MITITIVPTIKQFVCEKCGLWCKTAIGLRNHTKYKHDPAREQLHFDKTEP